MPYEGVYIEALRVLFIGLMLVVWGPRVVFKSAAAHEGLKVLWGAG